MQIDHIAIWTQNLEALKAFYETYFHARSRERYTNPSKQFDSYELHFSSGARLDLMRMPTIPPTNNNWETQFTGIIHIAFSTGSEEQANLLVNRLRADGHPIVGEPRRTGAGYYEAFVLDPDGNRVEITI